MTIGDLAAVLFVLLVICVVLIFFMIWWTFLINKRLKSKSNSRNMYDSAIDKATLSEIKALAHDIQYLLDLLIQQEMKYKK